ncbi:hypothetical protein ABPG77_006284 [Micractinium sp. CCAP 211/92]
MWALRPGRRSATGAAAFPLVSSCCAGITNPFIARGTRLAAKKASRTLTGVGPLDGLLHHLLTPAFLLPQALNLGGSVLFAAALSSCDISVAAPVANGVSLAANALFDHLLGDRLSSPASGIAGILLVGFGVTLCTLARTQQA